MVPDVAWRRVGIFAYTKEEIISKSKQDIRFR
jgi:hypothetical protein